MWTSCCIRSRAGNGIGRGSPRRRAARAGKVWAGATRRQLSCGHAPADDERVKPLGRPREGSLVYSLLTRHGQLLLRGWLVGFALLICSAMTGMFTQDILHERAVAVSVARSGALNLAESLA